MKKLRGMGHRVVFCDGTLFTRNTIKATAWSHSRRPITIDKHKVMKEGAFNVLAAVSSEKGLEYYKVIDGHINTEHFVTMMKRIARKGRNALVFTDGTSYFKSSKAKATANLLFAGRLVANIPYQPELNAIEQVNRIVKESYKRKRLESIVRNGNCDAMKLAG